MPARPLLPTTRFLVIAAIVVPICMVCILGALVQRSNAQVSSAAAWVAHTLIVKERLAFLSQRVVDAESSQRGYLLTGRADYLEPFEGAVGDIAPTVATLRRLTRDMPIQQNRLTQLQALMDQKLRELGETVRLFEAGQREKAMEIVLGGEGKDAMEAITALIDAMVVEEAQLLASRDAGLSTKTARNAAISWALVIAGLLCVGIIVSLIRRLERAKRLIHICAWSKTIEYEGQWISLEEYLRRRFGAEISHGISPAEAAIWEKATAAPPAARK